MEGTANLPPAGWYEDPDDAALQRFWDGSRWTTSRMPRNEGVPLEGEQPRPLPQPRYASDVATPPTTPEGATGLPAAAWYQDPENPSGMRYWDGAQWTEHRTDYLATPQPKRPSEGLVAAGYICSFLLPIAGLVIGAILLQRENDHGKWVLGLSILFMAAFILIGSLEEPS